jgi:hypothetical protein
MKNFIELGPVPYDEECVQVGCEDYMTKAKKECNAYIEQLCRLFGDVDLRIKSFPHDFGNYLEVVIYFDDETENDSDVAGNVADNLPANWDNEALKELGI